jgi:hypothetical protein
MNLPGLRWTGKAPPVTGGRQNLEETGEGAGGGKTCQGGAARDGVPAGREY